MSELSKPQIIVLSCALLLLLFIGVQQCKSSEEGISDRELFGTQGRGLLTGDVTQAPGSCVYNDPKWTICSCSEDSVGHVTFSYKPSAKSKQACKQDPAGKQDRCTASDSNAYYDYSCPSGDGTKNGNKIKRCTMICDGSDKCSDASNGGTYPPVCVAPATPGETCGNSVCGEGESCSTCPADCGTCTQCNDGVDNGDRDTLTDYPADPGCSSASDNGETDGVCDDNVDDASDSDSLGDASDPGCTSFSDTSEVDGQCDDKADNDGDGKIDYNGINNDGVNKDLGCTGYGDNDEVDCGDGVCSSGESNSNCPGDCPGGGGGSGFVQAQGTNLTLNGQKYTFIGFNEYGAANDVNIGRCGPGNNNGNNPNQYLDSMFATHKLYGYNALRFWAFQEFATKSSGVRDWTAIDRVISKAKANGFKVIPVLENHWGDCNDYGQKNDAWYTDGYKTSKPGYYPAPFRDYVVEFSQRYANEPGVMMIEIMNEPEGGHTVLKSFHQDIVNVIHSYDTNHEITTGTIGDGQAGIQNSNGDYKDLFSVLDVCVAHDYNYPTDPWPKANDNFNGPRICYNDCEGSGGINKPIIFGESGIRTFDPDGSCRGNTWDPTCYTKADRATHFDNKLDAALKQHNVDGYSVWQWNNNNSNYGGSCSPSNTDSYCVTTQDPLLDVMKKYAPVNQCPNGCPSGQYCDAGQCKPCSTKEQMCQGKQCGTVTNECGEQFSCGTCPSGQSCNANNQCESQTQCNDGVDNGDRDTVKDYPNDPGCSSSSDNDETDGVCDNNVDETNDADSLGDASDPGCTSFSDPSEVDGQCDDKADNDGDGKVDYPADAGCTSYSDNSEVNPQCNNGIDDDGDGKTDYPADPDCIDLNDDSEAAGGTLLTPPPNFKVAFIGDSGRGSGFENVLNLVKNEGADMAILPGDMSYGDTPDNADLWASKIRNILDPYWQNSGKMTEFGTNCTLFPFFISQGNHDKGAQWTDPTKGYRKFLRDRLGCHGVAWDDANHNGDWLGTRSSWAYQNVFMVTTADEGELGGNDDTASAAYVYDKLWKNIYLWDFSFHHKNQRRMQIYSYGDDTGWARYENVRKAGGMTFTAHTHTFARTWILDSMTNQNVVDNTNPLTFWNDDPALGRTGRGATTDVGSGGIGIRQQVDCLSPDNKYPYGCKGEWATVITNQDAGSGNGAYFLELNVDGDPRKARGYFKIVGSSGRWDEPGDQDGTDGTLTYYNDATVVS